MKFKESTSGLWFPSQKISNAESVSPVMSLYVIAPAVYRTPYTNSQQSIDTRIAWFLSSVVNSDLFWRTVYFIKGGVVSIQLCSTKLIFTDKIPYTKDPRIDID